MKLAFATIGEAPRDDLVPYLRSKLPTDLEVEEDGVLNHLDEAGRQALNARDDSLHMVTRARDGSAYKLSYERTLPHMQRVVDGLVARGADLVVILCGADWSPVTSSVPIVNPGRLFPNLVQALGTGLKLGVIKPDEGQIPHTLQHYASIGLDPVVTAASPYGSDRLELARRAAETLRDEGAELIWMTCVGMGEDMRDAVHEVLPRPTILARSVLARIIAELVGEPAASSPGEPAAPAKGVAL
jgi:protein AroM